MSKVILSGSKLSTLSKCSWLYYINYELGIRSGDNDGSRRGSICHIIFQVLLNKRHKKYVDKILKEKTIKNCLTILKLIKKISKKNKLDEFDNKDQNNFDLIEEMIITGLSLDFYCEGGILEKAETEFSYQGDGYEIRGAIDKIAKYGDEYKIFDYKSSSEKYTGEEEEFNVQSLMYSLWFYKTKGVIPSFRFIFLRFPDNPYIDKKYTEQEILGFEQYLIYISKHLEKFDLNKAKSNLAGKKGYPTDGSFSGLLACGYSKYVGHISPKTGKEYWSCPFKHPKTYYFIKDKNKNIKYNTDDADKVILEDSDTVEIFEYPGCICHYNNKYEN